MDRDYAAPENSDLGPVGIPRRAGVLRKATELTVKFF
jgi:hypothetical protein